MAGILFQEDRLLEADPLAASYGLTNTADILCAETIEEVLTVHSIVRRRVLTQLSGVQADASCIDVHTC